ncbi:MAG TPA: hypothetical protein VK116_00725, partial [Planctomycetota bacterium]|nr:hypothetical protein [Planctomycetota bacterium]
LLRDVAEIVDGTGHSALVAFPEGGDASIASDQLEALGFEIAFSKDVRDTLRSVETAEHDVVLADVTGWSPADRAMLWFLCGRPESRLVLFGPPGERTEELAKRVGVPYLTRPIEPRALVISVSRAIRSKSSAAERVGTSAPQASDDPATAAAGNDAGSDDEARSIEAPVEPGGGELDEGVVEMVESASEIFSDDDIDYSSVDEVLRGEDLDELLEAAEAAAGTESEFRGAEESDLQGSTIADSDDSDRRAVNDEAASVDAPEAFPGSLPDSAPARWRRFTADLRHRVRPDAARSERFVAFLECVEEHLEPEAILLAELVTEGIRVWVPRGSLDALGRRGEANEEAWSRATGCMFRERPPPSVLRVPIGSASILRGVLVAVFAQPIALAPRQLEELDELLRELVRL